MVWLHDAHSYHCLTSMKGHVNFTGKIDSGPLPEDNFCQRLIVQSEPSEG
jgi:hypothetical protein